MRRCGSRYEHTFIKQAIFILLLVFTQWFFALQWILTDFTNLSPLHVHNILRKSQKQVNKTETDEMKTALFCCLKRMAYKRLTTQTFRYCNVSIVCISNECFMCLWMYRFLFATIVTNRAFIEDFRCLFSPFGFRATDLRMLLLLWRPPCSFSVFAVNDLLHETQWHPFRSFNVKMKGIEAPAVKSACCENWFDV